MIKGYIQAGRVRSVNPKRRQARVTPIVPYERTFEDLKSVYFATEGNAPVSYAVEHVAEAGSSFVVTLDATVDFDTVSALRGTTLWLPEEAFDPGRDRPWRINDLVGLKVHNQCGEALGTVTEAYEAPANDAFAVENRDGARMILPAIEQVIESVDFAHKTVVVKDIGPYVVEVS